MSIVKKLEGGMRVSVIVRGRLNSFPTGPDKTRLRFLSIKVFDSLSQNEMYFMYTGNMETGNRYIIII